MSSKINDCFEWIIPELAPAYEVNSSPALEPLMLLGLYRPLSNLVTITLNFGHKDNTRSKTLSRLFECISPIVIALSTLREYKIGTEGSLDAVKLASSPL